MKPTLYRAEIDGLRAVSVLLIILFHLEVFGFNGGFVGVDVFFVISGYLITGIILGDLDREVFSFRRFYVRRITRIVPALLATVFFSLLAASVLFMPGPLIRTAEQSTASLLSVSNIYFWMDVSYWARSAKSDLLLHTWSLGVEEQFYLIYPCLLVASHRYFSKTGVVLLLVLLILGGTAASEFVLQVDATAAFFLTPLRFNEFAIGGLGSLLLAKTDSRYRLKRMTSTLGTLAGLALILFSAVTFSKYTLFPGVNVLIPTGGALLVILSGASPLASILLANPLMNWVGKLSYSFYLVHWPLIVLYRYCYGATLAFADCVILVIATLLFGALLNYLVERRFRLATGVQVTNAGLATGRALWKIGLATVLVCAIATATIVGQGWPTRIPASVKSIADVVVRGHARKKVNFLKEHCKPQGEPFCGVRKEGLENIMLLADSRGLDMYIALKSAFPHANIYASHALGCAPLFREQFSIFYKNCPQLNRDRLTAAVEAPVSDIVFLAMDFNAARGEMIVETVSKLVESGKRVYVLGESRFLDGKIPQEIAVDQARFSTDERYIERFLVEQPFSVDERYGPQINALGAVYISTRDFFKPGTYRLYTSDHQDLLSYDGLHLSVAGAREFGDYLAARYPLADF